MASLARSSRRNRSAARDQGALQRRLRELAAARVRYGYRPLHVLLRREGWCLNANRVDRLCWAEGLSLRLKPRKKRVSAARAGCGPRPNGRMSAGVWIS